MSVTVWLSAATLTYPEGGGHLWVYLNWALGLRALGWRVVWLEACDPDTPADVIQRLVQELKERLTPYGLAGAVALCSMTTEPLPSNAAEGCIDKEEASEADLLLNLSYEACAEIFNRFRRTALIDIDPGLFQIWLTEGQEFVPPHDVYFTTSEMVGRPGARFPDAGIRWHYTPPCVALDHWPVASASSTAPFSTVSHWKAPHWVIYGAESYQNDKREGFLPFLNLPRHTNVPLELALCLAADEYLRLAPDEEAEEKMLEEHGWRVRHAHAVASTPWDYQEYIQKSSGEFSWAKPSCVRLQNAWMSDRTLCYLASGKPAIVQHTGPSSFLPNRAGLFRFRDVQEAAECLETATADYERQCGLARALAEEYFDARKVAGRVLELALN